MSSLHDVSIFLGHKKNSLHLKTLAKNLFLLDLSMKHERNV
jgi:hypothetical protein